tara:strand:- start:2101 stop:2340 length:240 start_codon:yes stop_codon:yes gene_type:complete
MFKNIYIIILLAATIVNCSSKNTPKLLINNNNNICIGEAKIDCLLMIQEKCSDYYDLLKEEHYNYLFEKDKYIATFRCK